MRHSKRRKLNPEDINLALNLRNLEPLYGYGMTPEVKGEKLFRRAGTSDTFHIPDKVINLTDLVNQTRLPALPPDITWQAHWLAVEGVQPAIPENPLIRKFDSACCLNQLCRAGGRVLGLTAFILSFLFP